MSKFRINILGCGSATPTVNHNPSCQVIDFRDRLFMIDCGEGAQKQMRNMKLKFSRLSHIFISHLHGDHCFGLPGLLSTLSLLEKGGSVTVYMAPQGIKLMKEILAAFCHEITYDIIFKPVFPRVETIYEDHALTVETFPLYHTIPTVGYIFREKTKPLHLRGDMVKFHSIPVSFLNDIKNGSDYTTPDGTVIPNSHLTTPADPAMSYAYCSDTAFNPKVAEAVKGVNVLYHEATYDDSLQAQARQRGHSTARQAGTIARMAGVERLIIGHYSKRYHDTTLLTRQAMDEFPNVTAANERMTIDLL